MAGLNSGNVEEKTPWSVEFAEEVLEYDDACETKVDEWIRVEEESDREVGRIVSLVDGGREEDGGEELDDDIVYNESTRIGGNDDQGGRKTW